MEFKAWPKIQRLDKNTVTITEKIDGTNACVIVDNGRVCDLSFNHRGELRQHGLLTRAELPRWPTHWMPLPPPPTSEESEK